ncbi:(E)-4-hydroxy-3-methylbut-2-enyl-diphosphate synthase, partial [Candidatus Gastranaerophilus sp. (ex Termes propinquus)]
MDKKIIKIGDVAIGGGAPIAVQSMTTTRTSNARGVLDEIRLLADAGCELVRLAVLDSDCAQAILEIKKKSPIPIIADIHFDYRLAISCLKNGVDGLRLNPGNIGGV